MKKLFILSFFLLIAGMVYGQKLVTAASGSTVTLLANETSVKVTTTASDTIGGTAVKYWVFNINKPKLQFFALNFEVDSTKYPARIHGNRVQLKILGSLDNATWVQIGSTIFKGVNAGTSGDSTLNMADVATGVLWKYIKLEATGIVADHCATIPSITLKVAEK